MKNKGSGSLIRVHRLPVQVAAVAAVLALGGCGGGDGIEFNGKVFDWMGMGANSSTARDEPQLAQRAPLVPPPSLEKLPEPGSRKAPPPVAVANNWPGEDERAKQAALSEDERKKKEYCSSGGDWKSKSFGGSQNTPLPAEKAPYECPTLLNSIGDMFSFGKKAPDTSGDANSVQGAKPVAAKAAPVQ